MINPKDLRIGNYLRIKESDTVIQVETHMLSVSELINYAPIVLSPEILEKCGFEITGQTEHPNNIWTKYGEECKFELEQIIHFFLYDNKCFGTQVNYLHQLQNLYFALTGEELTFKP